MYWLNRLIVISIILTNMSCVRVGSVNFVDVAGDLCQTSHVRPVWYTGETLTTCKIDGKAVAEPTSHTDLSIASGILAAITAFAVVIPPLL